MAFCESNLENIFIVVTTLELSVVINLEFMCNVIVFLFVLNIVVALFDVVLFLMSAIYFVCLIPIHGRITPESSLGSV